MEAQIAGLVALEQMAEGASMSRLMDILRNLLDRKWILAVACLIVGIALGLIYAWQIDELEVIDATPDMLRQDLREDYLKMAVDSYSVNREITSAIERYENLGEFAEEALQAIGADPGSIDPTALQNFRAIITLPIDGEGTGEGSESPDEAMRPSPWRVILPVGGVIAMVGLLIAAFLARRSRILQSEEHYIPQASQSLDQIMEERLQGREAIPVREPLATFRTTYNLGDDSYDDSFSIESATGDFLGECGVGIADVIGVDGARKISAMEVWLFDKNDIQTVTKVLMSQHAYDDTSSRTRLAAKGDPVLVESGGVVGLETESLHVEARVVDFVYGEGVLPQRSFFERVTIELRAYQRE
jgi:hypothetical protein